MKNRINELKLRQTELGAIQSAARVLDWDQLTHMPKQGGAARGRHRAVLSELIHERATDAALGKLLDGLREDALSDDDAALVQVSRRDFEQAIRLPAKFVSDFSTHSSESYAAWAKAREANDFSIARPYLEKTVEMSREYSGFFPEAAHVADPHIDRSDPDMTVARIAPLFAELRAGLVPLVARLTAGDPVDDACLNGTFPAAKQVDFSRLVAGMYGFDFSRGRLDESLHPFTIRFHGDDVRITTRVREDDISDCLFSTLHEAGHGMYDQGIERAFGDTALASGVSSGVHESQSRLWENQVGRSRTFWQYLYPQLQTEFPEPFKAVPLDTFYRAINRVAPSLIRTDADEVTYNLHIMLRFDLELELLTGSLQVKDLPEAWNARIQADLGVTPPDPLRGVLQDIHWYVDHVGGAFQGYTIGNLAAAQLFGKALADHPEVMDEMSSGRFDTLKKWLMENIWRHGRRYAPDELIKNATGSDLSVAPFMTYLEEKYAPLAGA